MSLKLTINKFSNIHILSSVPLYLRTHYGWMGLACLILDGLAVLISCWVRSVVLLLFCGQKAHTQCSHISRGQSMWKYATNWLDLTWLDCLLRLLLAALWCSGLDRVVAAAVPVRIIIIGGHVHYLRAFFSFSLRPLTFFVVVVFFSAAA